MKNPLPVHSKHPPEDIFNLPGLLNIMNYSKINGILYLLINQHLLFSCFQS